MGTYSYPQGYSCPPGGPAPCPAVSVGMEHCDVKDAHPLWVLPRTPQSGVGISQSEDYTRSAHTEMLLDTGGKQLARRRNLFALDGTAFEITSKRATPTYYQYDTLNAAYKRTLDPTSVEIGKLGKLGSDGKLYVALPDGMTNDVTPWVRGKSFYGFKLGHTKHKLTIYANGVPLEPNKVVSEAEFCVGEKVVFTKTFSPPVPSEDIRAETYQWLLASQYVNGYEQYVPDPGEYWYFTCDPYSSGWSRSPGLFPDMPYCRRYKTYSWPLTQPHTGAWWVSGGKKSCGLSLDLTFNNGQQAHASATAKFQVHRPWLSGFHADANDFTWPVSYYGLPHLQADMAWDVTINSQYDGFIGVTQLINGTGFYYGTLGEYYLDGATEIYGEPDTKEAKRYFVTDPMSHSTMLGDNPRAPAPCDMNASFRDYVRFRPGSPVDDNIWITLGVVTWSMDGSVNILFQMTRSNIPPANPPVSSDEFPVWDHVFY
jgi:hypothetical protein